MMDKIDLRGIGRNKNLNDFQEHEMTVKTDDKKNESIGTGNPEKTDRIKISSEAKQLNIIDFAKNKMKAELHTEVSAERLGKLKSQIKSGTYNINAKMIAAAILSGTDA